jgi:hypothetical protein
MVTGFRNASFHFYFFFLKSATYQMTFLAGLQSTLHIREGPQRFLRHKLHAKLYEVSMERCLIMQTTNSL